MQTSRPTLLRCLSRAKGLSAIFGTDLRPLQTLMDWQVDIVYFNAPQQFRGIKKQANEVIAALFLIFTPSPLFAPRDLTDKSFSIYGALQVRPGNIIDLNGRLYEVSKLQHTQGHGRQLGNVQVGCCLLWATDKLSSRVMLRKSCGGPIR